MNAILLIGVMMCSLAEEDKLVARLDADFEALAAADPQRQQVREAARLLEETVQGGHQWQYRDALKILRQTRPKAALPLLMKYMLKHSGRGSPQFAIEEYVDTLSLLTGKDVAGPDRRARDRQAAVREGVQELADKWWTPHQAEITTNLDKMTPEQLEVVVDRLLKQAGRDGSIEPRSGRAEVTAYRFYQLMTYHIMHQGSSKPALWYPEELRPAMVPLILARAGYVKEPTAETRQARGRIPYAAIGLLADLRKNGGAADLPQIAGDAAQNTATRLTCTLALFAAGEELKTPVLLSILEKEGDLESRLVAILALQHSAEHAKTGAKLVELLDDPNSEIRTAAVCALRGPLPGAALPKLKKLVDAFDARQGYPFILDTLGEYRTREANAILVDFLRAGLEDNGRNQYLPTAVQALEKATGQRWSRAGAQSEELWRQQARAAVQWWDSGGKLQDSSAGRDAALRMVWAGADLSPSRPKNTPPAGKSARGPNPAAADVDREAKAAVPAVMELLKDNDKRTRLKAAVVLAKIGPDEAKAAVPAVMELLNDPQFRLAAAGTLKEIGPPAVPALTELVKGKDASLRATAVATLGKIGPGAGSAAAALAELLRDADKGVRRSAGEALKEIGPPAVAALRESLKDNDAAFRRAVAEVLWEISPRDETSIPTLAELIRDPDTQLPWPASQTARMTSFLSDRQGKPPSDYPAWVEFRKLAGDTAASRQLFGDMLAAEPGLCDCVGGDPRRLGDLLAQRLRALNDSDSIRRQHYTAGLGNVAAVFFVAARPDVAPFFNDDPRLFQSVDTVLRYGSSPQWGMNWDKPDPKNSIIQELVKRWVMLEGDPRWITIHLELAARFGLKDALDPLALRLVRHSEFQQVSGWNEVELWAEFALLTVRRLGKKEDCRFLAPYLERAAGLDYRFRPQPRRQDVDPQLLHLVDPQLRDLALGVAVELSGKKPSDYGLVEYQSARAAQVYLFQTIEQRNQGFALCIRDYKELGLEKPPRYTPETPARFYYATGRGNLRGSPTSPDGKTRLKLSGNKARLIDVATGQPIGKELDAGKWNEGRSPEFTFTCYSFSPDGKYVVTGSSFVKKFPPREDTRDTNVGRIEVWDAASGEPVEKKTRGATGSVRAVGFSDDGKAIDYEADKFSLDIS
jgi:HEAT repeat protein